MSELVSMVNRKKLTAASCSLLSALCIPGCINQDIHKYEVNKGVVESGPMIRAYHRFVLVGAGGSRFVVLGSNDFNGPYIGEALLTDNGRNQAEFLSTDSSRLGEKVYTIISESFAGSEIASDHRRRSWTGALLRGYNRAVSQPLIPQIQVQIVRLLLSQDTFARNSGCNLFVFGNSQDLFGLEFTEPGLERILQITGIDGVNTKQQRDKLIAGSCIRYDAPYGSLAVGSSYRGHLLLTGKKTQIGWRVIDCLTQI
jgi:hypothetical protein